MTEAVKHVIWLENLGRSDVPRVGGKNASLGELVRHFESSGVRVPPEKRVFCPPHRRCGMKEQPSHSTPKTT